MADTIDEAITEQALGGVQRTTQDGHSAEAVPIPDLIAAKRFQVGQEAAANQSGNGLFGLRVAQIVPGGGANP